MSKIILEKPIKIHSAETLEYVNYIKQDAKVLNLGKSAIRQTWAGNLLYQGYSQK